MTEHVSVGATDTATFAGFATKAALRRALTSNSATVIFQQTSMFASRNVPAVFVGQNLPELLRFTGISLTVVGPDPETDRRWYASVTVNAAGTVVVK